MSKIYIMMGIPGSGKSTFVKSMMEDGDVWISRDLIRFAILKDGDSYFSKEDEVFKQFVENINLAIRKGANKIYVDATHLNTVSRAKVISKIYEKYEELNLVYVKVPLELAIERNNRRSGRSLVPETSIREMYAKLQGAQPDEGFDHYYVVNNIKERNDIE